MALICAGSQVAKGRMTFTSKTDHSSLSKILVHLHDFNQ